MKSLTCWALPLFPGWPSRCLAVTSLRSPIEVFGSWRPCSTKARVVDRVCEVVHFLGGFCYTLHQKLKILSDFKEIFIANPEVCVPRKFFEMVRVSWRQSIWEVFATIVASFFVIQTSQNVFSMWRHDVMVPARWLHPSLEDKNP